MRMKKKIQKAIFSLPGVSIFIGVLGFLAGIVTLFFDVNSSISIKWLLATILLSVTFVIILLKFIYDLSPESVPLSQTPIKYVESERVFVIRRNENFVNTIIVGCYVEQDEIERLAYLGSVHLVQDKMIQIKIWHDFKVLDEIPRSKSALAKIVVKSVVPVEALSQFRNQENSDE